MSIIDRMFHEKTNKNHSIDDIISADLHIYSNPQDYYLQNIKGEEYSVRFIIECCFINYDQSHFNKQLDMCKDMLKRELYKDIIPYLDKLQFSLYERNLSECHDLLKKILDEVGK